MEIIQVAIANTPYASALREVLLQSGSWEVVCVDVPDASREGVLVLDPEHLERLPRPLRNPERVVLLTRNEPADLSRAWDAGVTSVIYDNDPLNTAVLAIMAAQLKAPKARTVRCRMGLRNRTPRLPGTEDADGGLGPPSDPSHLPGYGDPPKRQDF